MDLEAAVDAMCESEQPVERQREGLETLRKLMSNVRDQPDQAKFREVKKMHPAIQKRLFPQCFDFLAAAGFEDRGDVLLYRSDPGPVLHEAILVVESLLLSLGGAPAASSSSTSPAPATTSSSSSSAARSATTPAESKKTIEARKQELRLKEAAKSQAAAQEQLAALRQRNAGKYQQEQDLSLARHLGSSAADQPYDAITALNQSRGAVHSFVTCSRCGCSLRYNSSTRAQAVLCPCGNLLQPIAMRGQAFAPRSPSDLPVEPGEPVDTDNQPTRTRGPFITVRGPDGEPARLPLHSVLQMVRQHEGRQLSVASEETIEALPTRKFEAASSNAADSGPDHGTNCQICMEDFAEGDELRTLPCFHLFHSNCVDQWLKVNSICPTCRHKVG